MTAKMTPRRANHRTEVFGISVRNNENLFSGVTLAKKLPPSAGAAEPRSLKQKPQAKEAPQSIIVRLPQLADEESEFSFDPNDGCVDVKLVDPKRKMTLPIPVIKRKKVPELQLKSIPTCEVVQFTDRDVDTLKQEEHIVYPVMVNGQSSGSRSKQEIAKTMVDKQLVNKVALNIVSQTSANEQNDKLPSLLKSVMDEKNGKILYIPLTEMKSLCRIESNSQESSSPVLNLSSIIHFQDLRYREYRAKVSPRLEPKGNTKQSATNSDAIGSSTRITDANRQADEEFNQYYDQLRNSIRKRNLNRKKLEKIENPLVSQSLMAMPYKEELVLPALLVQDANKRKTGREKVLQQKFDETIKIYQRTKEKIYQLERKAKLDAQRKTSKSLPRREPLHVNPARTTQSEGRLTKRQLPALDPLNEILCHVPAIRCSISPPPTKKNAVIDNTRSETRGSGNENKSSRKTPRKILNEKRKPVSGPKHTPERLPQDTSRDHMTRQMFQTSDYDQFCHTKHRRARRSDNPQQAPTRISREINPNPKEYLKVKIGIDPRHLDDNDYVTDGVQSIQSDTIENTNGKLLLTNEPKMNSGTNGTDETISLPRLVATDNRNPNAKNPTENLYLSSPMS